MRPERVLIAHNRVEAGADPSTLDVLAQVALVRSGLEELGVPYEVIPVAGHRIWEAVQPGRGIVVFNLVEAPPGAPLLQSACAAALELLGVPFTGTRAAAMWLSTDKLATRAILADAGLAVAAGGRLWPDAPAILDEVRPPWIIKPGWEDASVGLEGAAVCSDRAQAIARGRELAARFPEQPLVVEHFLPGREFNVSLLAGGADVEVLPVAEMTYVDFPPEMPRILGYEGKWLAGSFEDEHTRRCFPSEEEDGALLAEVRRVARHAWRVCGLAGYARVDIRLDEAGRACVLEVNANPCLAADAGFVAAAARAGLTPGALVERILEAALRAGPSPCSIPAGRPVAAAEDLQ